MRQSTGRRPMVRFSGGCVGTLGGHPLSLSVVPFQQRIDAPAAVCIIPPRRADNAPHSNRATEVIYLDAAGARELAHALGQCAWAVDQLNQPAPAVETHAQTEREALDSAIGDLVSGFGDLPS